MRVSHWGSRLRAGGLAAALVLLTLTAHTAAQGGSPNLLGMALVLALALAFSIPASRVQWSPPRLLTFFIGGQFLLHAVLALAGGHGSHASWLPTPPMAFAHIAAAALVTGLALYFDRAIATAIQMARTLLGVSVQSVPRIVHSVAGVSTSYVPSNVGFITRQAHLRRGPPVFAC